MPRDIFLDREHALEYEFFHKVDLELWKRLKDKLALEKNQKALADATGIQDPEILAELVDLGIRSESIYALSLFPLVWAAWADGKVEEDERRAVLEAAHAEGHEKDTASHHLLELWLEHQPDEKLMAAWRDYVQGIRKTLSPEAKKALKKDILSRTRTVAKAAGGVLGFHKISSAQEKVLQEVEKAFDTV